MCVHIYIWRYYRGESKCVIKACRTYIMIDNTIRIMRVCHARLFMIHLIVKPILLGVTFSNAVSKLKAQSSNVSFHWNVAKETLKLWALSFRKWHPKWDWLYLSIFDMPMYIMNTCQKWRYKGVSRKSVHDVFDSNYKYFTCRCIPWRMTQYVL